METAFPLSLLSWKTGVPLWWLCHPHFPGMRDGAAKVHTDGFLCGFKKLHPNSFSHCKYISVAVKIKTSQIREGTQPPVKLNKCQMQRSVQAFLSTCIYSFMHTYQGMFCFPNSESLAQLFVWPCMAMKVFIPNINISMCKRGFGQ